MRILLLGAHGQLGWELHRSLSSLGTVLALEYPQIDLKKPDLLRNLIQENNPQVVVNAAAYTAVDQAEAEPEIAMAVNGDAPGILADLTRRMGAIFIHYSTDYVFDGEKGSAYIEPDTPNPLNIYGKSKLLGEQTTAQAGGAYLIFRTSWVYSLRMDSFVNKVLKWAHQYERLKIVSDQIGSPTWSRMLAEITALMLARASGNPDLTGWIRERHGIYHLAGSGNASRFEWAQAIIQNDPDRQTQVCKEITPVSTGEFPTPARRPLWSALNCELFKQTFGLSMPDWRESLHFALEQADKLGAG
jgi:dTDP-4-dehydrorhamnose reductase